ncbi:DUF5071 domain-containing protein [Aureivirga sp. CE67]|uniref:DUF5071 domain-containing protein n=1 Tax=Aureivirga sp. CE67 TaxID=1788983 RepID=UPI0018C8D909|nr:DUF5071 domain-containing protein [Aureivirga sp. CE67]
MNLKDWIYEYDSPDKRQELEHIFKNSSPLTDSEINQLLTENYVKYEGAGYLLLHTDSERLKHRIPELLTWIQDMNWPAASKIHELLVLFGEDIIDPIKEVFKKDPFDSIWHYNIIYVLFEIDSFRLNELKNDLIHLVKKADEDGAALAALELLHNKKILTQKEIDQLIDYLIKYFENKQSCTEDLNELITKIDNKELY